MSLYPVGPIATKLAALAPASDLRIRLGWTVEHVQRAHNEGWYLSLWGIEGASISPAYTYDNNPALEHVNKCADEGSEFHTFALAMHTAMVMRNGPRWIVS